MTEFILPPGVTMPKPIEERETPDDVESGESRATMLPDPTGWKLLCVVPDISEKFDGTSLLKATTAMRAEEHATSILFVLKMGADAYKDENKFPTGAWCKVGDFVLVRNYTGTRFKIYGKEFRVINDDQVEAVVLDPRGITRVAI